MQHINRKTVIRISAMIMALMIILSSMACFAAASFKKGAAGVKYNGKTVKLGSSTSEKTLKSVFGKNYTIKTVAVCSVVPYGGRLYKFKSKGVEVETRYMNEAHSKEQIITITVTTKTVPTIAGLKVGNKVSTVATKYGKKCKRNGTTVLYTSGNYDMFVYTKSKKVQKIVFMIDL